MESRRAKEVRLRRERENEREGEKMMLEWSMLKKMWKKKKENVSSMSSESQKKAKDLQWCKYSVMKRRTESLLDLAESKGALRQGFKTRPQSIVRSQNPLNLAQVPKIIEQEPLFAYLKGHLLSHT